MTAMVDGLTPLATGFCFGEGPRWFEGLLWFSDMLGEAVHTVTVGGAMTTLAAARACAVRPGLPAGRDTVDRVHRKTRRCWRYDGETVDAVARSELTLAPANLGDMVVDHRRPCLHRVAGFQGGVILRVDPDRAVLRGGRELDFPNGMAITPDRSRR